MTIRPLRTLTRSALTHLEVDGDIVVALVDDAQSQALNRDYLGRDRATNVLSFPDDEPGRLGELAVNVEWAAREGEASGYGQLYMIGYYLLHGLLHLVGYDHERTGDAAARRMQRAEHALRELLTPLASSEEGK